MTASQTTPVVPEVPVHSFSGVPANERRWRKLEDRFLEAIAAHQRPAVAALLRYPRCGGAGLRQWLRALALQNRTIPDALPPELIQVYLKDPEALPLHDCGDCGLAIPVHAGQRFAQEDDLSRSYFPRCPACGGLTGLYAFWSNAARLQEVSQSPSSGSA